MKEDIKITNEFWVGVAVGVVWMLIIIIPAIIKIATGYAPWWIYSITGGLWVIVLILGQRIATNFKKKKSEAL